MSLFTDSDLLNQFNLIVEAQDAGTKEQAEYAARSKNISSVVKKMISELRNSFSGGINVSDTDAAQLTNLDSFLQKLLNEKSSYNNLPIVSGINTGNIELKDENKENFVQYNNKYSIYLPGFNAYLQTLRNNLATSGDNTFLPLVNNLISQAKQAFGNKTNVETVGTAVQNNQSKNNNQAQPTDLKEEQGKNIKNNEQLKTFAADLFMGQRAPFKEDGHIYLQLLEVFVNGIKQYLNNIHQTLSQKKLQPDTFFPFNYGNLIAKIDEVLRMSQNFKNAYRTDNLKLNASNPNVAQDFGKLLRRNSGQTLINQQIKEAAQLLDMIIKNTDDILADLVELFTQYDLGINDKVKQILTSEQQIIDQRFGILDSIQRFYSV